MTLVTAKDSVPLWQFESLAAEQGLLHFVSTRRGGISGSPYDSLNLSFNVGDDPVKVATNRNRLFTALDVRADEVITCTQVHGNGVIVAPSPQRTGGAPHNPPEADALATAKPGALLMLLMADCVPVLVYDPLRHVAGIAHAGWSGTVQHVTARLIQRMEATLRSQPAHMLAGIGPSIGPCCYEVGAGVIERVRSALPAPDPLLRPHPAPGKAFFDLWRANRDQLIACGVPERQIELASVCTKCHISDFFSDRAQRPAGRFAAGVMLL